MEIGTCFLAERKRIMGRAQNVHWDGIQGIESSYRVPWSDTDHPSYFCFPVYQIGKESACNAGDSSLIPGSGRSPGEGKGYPLQYSGLENSMDCIAHGLTKSQTWLSGFHFHVKCLVLWLAEKAMAPHSSTLAWKILWTVEPRCSLLLYSVKLS